MLAPRQPWWSRLWDELWSSWAVKVLTVAVGSLALVVSAVAHAAWAISPLLSLLLAGSIFSVFVAALLVWRGRDEWEADAKRKREARATADAVAQTLATVSSLLSNCPAREQHGDRAVVDWMEALRAANFSIEHFSGPSSELPEDVAVLIRNPTNRPSQARRLELGLKFKSHAQLPDLVFSFEIARVGLSEALAIYCSREGIRGVLGPPVR